MRPTNQDTLADDFEMEAITIPTAGGVTVQSLRVAKPYDDKIMGWEIIDNADAIDVGKAAALTVKTSPGAAAGFAPPVGKTALETTFVKASGGVDVSAVLVLYVASVTVRIPREPTVQG